MHSIQTPLPYACGDRIGGKYQLIRPLSAGGMGVVWVAHNLTLDVHVAIKLIRGSVAGEVATARLLYEARSAARIAHPGVVRVFDFGTTARGDPFVVMELLEGETLRDLIEREMHIDPLRAVAILLPIADALATLADNGIVHRDLKPENVILVQCPDQRLQPKLVDFGIAILPGERRLTIGDVVVGTPEYLAPEQAAGEDIDHRADVWAFTVVLFEMLTGALPFTADSPTELLSRILLATPPSISDFGVHDVALSAIVARGLAKLREERWASMRVAGQALAAWARDRGLTEDVTGATVRARSTSAEPSRASMHVSSRALSVAQPRSPAQKGARDPFLEEASYPPSASEKRTLDMPYPAPARSKPWPRPVVLLLSSALALIAVGVTIGLLRNRPESPVAGDAAPVACAAPSTSSAALPSVSVPAPPGTATSAAPSADLPPPPSAPKPVRTARPAPIPSDLKDPFHPPKK